MALCTRGFSRLAKTSTHRTQWRRIPHRYYSSNGPAEAREDPEWFQKLRTEMLNRDLPAERDYRHKVHEQKLARALSSFLPKEWAPGIESKSDGIGNHLIFCNATIPDERLLPDGTDALHSPGGPFVRRMWAGGVLKIVPHVYHDSLRGWDKNKAMICGERIKEVCLRGEGDNEKIVVTIERKFTGFGALWQKWRAVRKMMGGQIYSHYSDFLREEATEAQNWRGCFLIEDRNLVFLRERSPETLAEIKAGKVAPVKYLLSPGPPEFSQTLTPTSTLLFRFSALTNNAHHIHLDREYARNVEGYRNLLVHGPLTLMLMLKLIGAHLHSLEGPQHTIEFVKYRNLAPLFCDEELRVCARERISMLRTDDGRKYDVWVEGPTGGMAVKGLVRTVPLPSPEGQKSSQGGAESIHRYTVTDSDAAHRTQISQDTEHLVPTHASSETTSKHDTRLQLSRPQRQVDQPKSKTKQQETTSLTPSPTSPSDPVPKDSSPPSFSSPSVPLASISIPSIEPSTADTKASSETPRLSSPTRPQSRSPPRPPIRVIPTSCPPSAQIRLQTHRTRRTTRYAYDPKEQRSSSPTRPQSESPPRPPIRVISTSRPTSAQIRKRTHRTRRTAWYASDFEELTIEPIPLIRYHRRNLQKEVVRSPFGKRGHKWISSNKPSMRRIDRYLTGSGARVWRTSLYNLLKRPMVNRRPVVKRRPEVKRRRVVVS